MVELMLRGHVSTPSVVVISAGGAGDHRAWCRGRRGLFLLGVLLVHRRQTPIGALDVDNVGRRLIETSSCQAPLPVERPSSGRHLHQISI